MTVSPDLNNMFASIDSRLKGQEATGESVTGLVQVTIDSSFVLKHIEIDHVLAKTLFGDDGDNEAKEMLEECIKAAFVDARQKIIDKVISEIKRTPME